MTLLNADLGLDATVLTESLAWDPSPSPGVWRRRIERRGDEVARLTSVVRYAPNSTFPAHMHGGGEEYYVLSGTFSDEHGDHHAGAWVRNGVGSRHSPFTVPGCEILVRLWWMHPNETRSLVIDTTTSVGWQARPWGRERVLHHSAYELVRLLEFEAGQWAELDADGGLELFVLDGEVNGLCKGAWARRVGRTNFAVQAGESARLLVRHGHLKQPPPLPNGV